MGQTLYVLGFNSGRLSMLGIRKEMPSLQIFVCLFCIIVNPRQAHSSPAHVYLQIEPGKRIDSEPLGAFHKLRLHFLEFFDHITPPRTPRISRLKSQIMKPTFLS